MSDPRPPLYLTPGEASMHFSLFPHDAGREVIIVESHIRPCPPEWLTKPLRKALGWNGQGEWIWLDAHGNPEGRWP